MTLQAVGQTTNFTVDYDDSLVSAQPPANQAQTKANLIANCNSLLGQVETAFTTTTGWFGTDVTKFGTGHRQQVNLDQVDGNGASNNGYGNSISQDGQSQNSSATAGPIVSMLWMAEWSEVLMSLTSNWNAGDSSGEGLSQFCAGTLFLAGHNDYYGGGFIQNWLNGGSAWSANNKKFVASPNAARSDWVTQTFTGVTTSAGDQIHGDGDEVSFGCALCFIYYLTVELGFTINEVIANYKDNLASCYHSVTGDQANPFPGFAGLLAAVFPPSQTFTPATTNPDNPFPIAQVQFYAQKNIFGKDEAFDIITRHGGLISQAFWVVIDGLSKQAFQNLGVQVAAFTGTFSNFPGVTISPNAVGPEFQNGVPAKSPQRIRIPFDITLSDTPPNSFIDQFPSTGVGPELGLSVTLTAGGQPVTGSSATMFFELTAGADPYFTNIPAGGTNEAYLSQDLRVFGAAPALNNTPFPGGPNFTDDSPTGAYTYIKALLGHLNGHVDFTNPDGTDAFSLLPDQAGEGETDTSVAPFRFTGAFPPIFAKNYNFAIARVRLRGIPIPPDTNPVTATDVRVFFRVFQSQSADTDFDPNGTYKSNNDPAGHPGTPVPGAGDSTIPFFATNNAGSQTDYQAGGPNIQTLTIPITQESVYAYYGCFLNFYDPANVVDNQQVLTYFPGSHHCIAAELAYDLAPIPSGVSPLSWDQLAQRNLQFTAIENPGFPAAHRAPQTFDTRPSKAIGTPLGSGLPPDELMIDWGHIPKGSIASIYWPAVSAADVIALAQTWGGAAGLGSSDANTLTLKVEGGVSYIPIPKGAGDNFAGLFTVEVPPAVTAGQQFEVLVRRIATRRGKPPPPPPPPIKSPPAKRAALRSPPARKMEEPSGAKAALAQPTAVAERLILWRYVVGAFVVRIPVTTAAKMRIPEEMTLAGMKWRLEHLSPGNRWVPVLKRYIEYLSGRLVAIGGDPGSVPPSINWHPPIEGEGGGKHGREVCGKVAEVLYDCHGEFEGFVIDECCEPHLIKSRDRGLGELVLVACRENLTLCVRLCRDGDKVEGVVIRG
jgi:hypothetical protein